MTVRFSKRAQFEASRAYNWYSIENEAAGESFLRRLDAVVEQLTRFPRLGMKTSPTLRRIPMTPFPYALYYRVTGDEVVVIACHHQRRRNPPRK